ncbi:MAG: hypothetical protein ACFB0G_17470 [Leptolyngbyaceae cyanobacterium]
MGAYYEFGFICDLKKDLSPGIVDTLAYMTRSEDYDFQTALKDRLFCPEAYPNPEGHEEWLTNWRNIIRNTPSNRRINISPSDPVSLLTEEFLCFRLHGKLDDLVNSIWPLLDWLTTVRERETFPNEIVGFYEEICYPETRRFWCFNHEEIVERDVTPAFYEDVEQLHQEIVELLPNRDD